MHRAGLLPEDWVARGLSIETGRKLLAATMRGESEVRGVSRDVLRRIEAETSTESLRVARRETAPDGFVKYLFDIGVEAVRIPVPCEAPGADLSAFEGREKKYIVCVSSQVGCALACAFCATGEMGFLRNLEAAEIVGQVLAIRAQAGRPERGVVFMGMGEPLLNYDRVIQAARILSHPCGGRIDPRAITIPPPPLGPPIR